MWPVSLAVSTISRQQHFPANHADIRVTGRTVTNGTSLYHDWSSVYFEFAATGPVALNMQERWSHGNEYSVTLATSGSVRSFQFNTTNATVPKPFDLGLASGETATVRVEKVTEARTDAGGLVQFLGITAEELLPLPAALHRTKKVVCIGDSMMCGCHSE